MTMRNLRKTDARIAAGLAIACALSALLAGPVLAQAQRDTVLARLGTETVTTRDFRTAAVKFGIAPDSLGADDVRGILGALLDQHALRAVVARQPAAWTPADSAEFGQYRDQLAFDAAIDSAYAAERLIFLARGEKVPRLNRLGVAMRDSAMRRLKPVFDEEMLVKLAGAFDAIPQPGPDDDILARGRKLLRFPAVAPGDSDRVLVTFTNEPYTVRDVLEQWKGIAPLDRPHIGKPTDLRQFVSTALYHRLLREQAMRDRLLERPDLARQVRERAELNAIRAWRRVHIDAGIPRDSTFERKSERAFRAAADSLRRAMGESIDEAALLRLAAPNR